MYNIILSFLFPTDHRVQEEVNALWEGEGFSSLED